MLGALLLWQTGYWARELALENIRDRSSHTLTLIVENLRGKLAKYRSQPQLIASNVAFRHALQGNASDDHILSVNEELARVNTVSGAMATYLMDRTGLTIAASNYASEQPFIGRNFSFRPYFQSAMQGQLGSYFALGTTSKKRGYYFAYPVRDAQSVLGAIVVKVAVGDLESGWRSTDHEIVVADADGVVFLSSDPDWRYHTLQPLSDEARIRLQTNKKYADQPFTPLFVESEKVRPGLGTFFKIGQSSSASSSRKTSAFLAQEAVMAEAGWRVLIMARTTDVGRQIWTAVAIAGFMLVSLLLAAANVYQRRRRLAERMALQERAKAQLERRVDERTDELTQTNAKLRSEIGERERTEVELRRTQNDLVQATKLAALGQMSAGLSHELNQPLAAIRSYADNARAYLGRGDTGQTITNLLGISELTERMARITKHLRTFARKGPVEMRPISVAAALDEALKLLADKLVRYDITINKTLPEQDLLIMGGDVRLQQIFVNLLNNAIDALEPVDNKQINIDAYESGPDIVVNVHDTGTGVSESDLPNIFDPFFTSKDVGKGLGLGLSITFGLVKQFGGTIAATNADSGGAIFTLTFAPAREEQGRAA